VIVTVATTNAAKVNELAAILSPKLELVLPAVDYRAPEEAGSTYVENARIKARALYAALGRSTLADDSGLEVDALGGQPGLHSARYGATAQQRNRRLLEALRGHAKGARLARFRTALVLLLDDSREIAVEGCREGEIAEAPRGTDGFGYDPIFVVPELGRTLAELTTHEKNGLSSRALAARALLAELLRLRR